MNMLAYEANAAWNRGIPCIFLKLIQIYLLCSFISSLTYCITEFIKGTISWRLNENSVGLWGSYGLKQGNPLRFFQNTKKKLFVLFIFSILTYCIKEGIKNTIFDNNLKLFAYEAATAWHRGIHSKILKFLIKLYLFCLLL